MCFYHSVSFSWWDDVFAFDALNLSITILHILEVYNTQSDLLTLVFDNFKTRAIVADKSLDSHPVIVPINDTEDAQILLDEIFAYKGACVFLYFANKYKLSDIIDNIRDFFATNYCKVIDCNSVLRIFNPSDNPVLKSFLDKPKVNRLSCVIDLFNLF
jgi:hypothetical protein